MKITERTLRDDCMAANKGPLKDRNFGLKVEKLGEGFMVYQLFRKVSEGQRRLLGEPLPGKETKAFITGFVAAIQSSECLRTEIADFGSYALTCRRENTEEWMEGLAEKVNHAAESIGDNARFHFDGDSLSPV